MKDAGMVLCLILAGVLGAQGADRDFEAIVHRLEAHYGKKRTSIPLLGLGSFFVKMARPEGVKDLQMAVFEDLPSDSQPSPEALAKIFAHLPEQGWKPFVRVWSRRDGERVEIFSRFDGKAWHLLLATLEPAEATVMEMRLSADALAKWINDPETMARGNKER